ncbi:uncharacterized protein LOC132797899 [Drosophila nasuta]|uniref:uncharacterized protein LOC132797899 n=1 Tax=Drosophila nasuta TaxID=42062 RepID=UPI00295F3BF6|nr:uncharacterized protein LOC132797899 [Drosophila nasuta]
MYHLFCECRTRKLIFSFASFIKQSEQLVNIVGLTSQQPLDIELEVRQLREERRRIQNGLGHVLAILSQIVNIVVPAKTEFPLRSEEHIAVLNTKIEESPLKYATMFRRMLCPDGILKNLERIFHKDVLMGRNYAGTAKIKAFNKYRHLNNAMFKALKTDNYSFEDYKKAVREAFFKFKNRNYKALARARQLEILENNK